MNGITRKKLYDLVAKRDGEFCRCCGALPHERQLVIDHRDNNSTNNFPGNLQLLCRACNYIKNPRPENYVCEKIRSHYDTELEVNRKKEPQFKMYVNHQINERTQVSWDDLKYSGAEILDISPETAERYLRKLTSSAGIYQTNLVGDNYVVEFKDELSEI